MQPSSDPSSSTTTRPPRPRSSPSRSTPSSPTSRRRCTSPLSRSRAPRSSGSSRRSRARATNSACCSQGQPARRVREPGARHARGERRTRHHHDEVDVGLHRGAGHQASADGGAPPAQPTRSASCTSAGSAGARPSSPPSSTVGGRRRMVLLVPLDAGLGARCSGRSSTAKFRRGLPDMLAPFWYDVQIFLWCAPCIVVLGLTHLPSPATSARRRCIPCGCSPRCTPTSSAGCP